MSITPRGMSVQEAYRLYAEGKLFVNRKYQRKLVWTVEEKEHLIDSIMRELPIPLILLAQVGEGEYEIIDGVQRFNAIFSFIENRFSVDDRYFDVTQFSRAKQAGDAGNFSYQTNNLFPDDVCARSLDYQLAVTIYPSASEETVTDIFGRINSGGRQLSNQEKRQAGVINPFANLVRFLSSEIRGDVSRELLPLSDMPEISIDSERENIGYGLKAEEIFWVEHGVLWKNHLRESEDEETITDIVASILLGVPLARSKEKLDDIYDVGSAGYSDLSTKLSAYGLDKIKHEIKVTLSVIKEVFFNATGSPKIRSIVNPGSSNPVKNSFYTIFMAFFRLIVTEGLSPCEYDKIIGALKGLNSHLKTSAHYASTADRTHNINLTIGLIRPYFIAEDPPVLRHGPGLALDLENSIRRSKVETNRYECKQGLYDLGDSRAYNTILLSKIVNTICGIANIGPDADGFVFIGIADKRADAEKIELIDSIQTVAIVENRYVVGIDRELKIEGLKMDGYLKKICNEINKSALSDTLKKQVLSQIDIVEYKKLSVIRLRVPQQEEVSFVGEKCYTRQLSDTTEVKGKDILTIQKLFSKNK
jgi:hypothetical protein